MPPTNPKTWRPDWVALRRVLLQPRVADAALESALNEARARQPLPVIWLLGKAQSGKTSIIRALTGSPNAVIGNGFRACTRTARGYDFPADTPVVRFLDTRGLGETAYDPREDIDYCESQAHLILGVMKATDLDQAEVFRVLQTVRRRHPRWPVIIAQTGLHEAYPPGAGHCLPYPFEQQPWPPAVPRDLTRALHAQRAGLGTLSGDAAAQWVPIDLTLPEDGLEPADYGLAALWTAIGDVSAAGLRALLGGDAEVRDTFARTAHPHIVGYALAAAGVGALPAVDLVMVPAIQAKLLHSLAAIYGQRWSGQDLSEFLGLLGLGIGTGYLARLAGRGLIKWVPVLGQTLGVLWGATASGATTYALGKAACYYFGTRRLGERIDSATLRRIYAQALAAGAQLLASERAGGGHGESELRHSHAQPQ